MVVSGDYQTYLIIPKVKSVGLPVPTGVPKDIIDLIPGYFINFIKVANSGVTLNIPFHFRLFFTANFFFPYYIHSYWILG